MRSAVVVLSFVAVAALGAWFYLRSHSSEGTASAGPAVAAGTAPTRAAPPTALTGPEAGATAERASVAEPVTTAAITAAKAGPGAALGVSGRVVDASGRPIPGALVLGARGLDFARWPVDARGSFVGTGDEVWRATTDGAGRFTLSGVRPGTLRLAVRAAGFAHLDLLDVAVPAAASHDLGDLELTLGAVLSGRVVDVLGRPVAGAELLRLSEQESNLVFHFGRPPGVPLATTDAAGRFVIDTLPAGPYRLLTTSDAHPDQVTRGATERPGQRVDGLEIVLAQALEISGRVVGAPADLAGSLRIQAWPELANLGGAAASEGEAQPAPHYELRHADVDADGSFVVRGARVGTRYQLSGVRSDREADWFGDALTARRTVESGATGVELAYQPESSLVFQVVDRATQRPLEEFEVQAGSPWPMPLNDEKGRTKRSHAEGRVHFGRLRPNADRRVTLRIEAVGYETYSRDDILLGEGEQADLGVIELVPAPVLAVRVLDATTGRPVAGAKVELSSEAEPSGGHQFAVRISNDGGGDQVEFGDAQSARTDELGVARLTAIQSARCRLRIAHDEYAPQRSELFELALGASAERTVHLGRGGSVHVKLVAADGKPMVGARVERRAPDAAANPFLQPEVGLSGGVVTDADGVAHFTHLAPGVHGFRAKLAGAGGAAFSPGGMDLVVLGEQAEDGDPWTEVEVAEGSESAVTVVAPELSRVHGRVTEGGRPLAGASVRLAKRRAGGRPSLPFGPSGPSAVTAADGSYVIENVRADEYTATLSHAERVMPVELDVLVNDLDERLDFDLALAVLEGRVLDAQGQPIANAEVWPERARESGGRPAVRARAVMIASAGGAMTTFGDGGDAPRVRTDAEGRYQLRGVTPDVDLVVKCRASKYQPGESERVRVAADQQKGGVDLELERAGALEISVASADPEGQRFYLVRATWTGEGPAPEDKNEMTNDSGKLLLDGLKPGPWKLSVRRLAGFGSNGEQPPPSEQAVEVRDGQTSPVIVELP